MFDFLKLVVVHPAHPHTLSIPLISVRKEIELLWWQLMVQGLLQQLVRLFPLLVQTATWLRGQVLPLVKELHLGLLLQEPPALLLLTSVEPEQTVVESVFTLYMDLLLLPEQHQHKVHLQARQQVLVFPVAAPVTF